MEIEEAQIGVRVRTTVPFAGIAPNTEGVIDEDYITGVMVAWDLPNSPLPEGYSEHNGCPMIVTGILRDGFDKDTELHFLQEVK